MPENNVIHTTTTSRKGSAPRKSSVPQIVQPSRTHNQITCSIWKV